MIEKTKEKWWEAFKYQCPSCRKYLCFKFYKEDKKYYYKKCSECGIEIKKEIVFADYKMENGKSFLKRNGWNNYREVELRKVGNALQVLEVQNKLL